MWPVGLSEDEAARIRDDLARMRRARRLARCAVWLRRAAYENRVRQCAATEPDRATKQSRLYHRVCRMLVDVCHG